MPIQAFEVTQPPNSGEVQDQVLTALGGTMLVTLTLRPEQQVPQPVDRNMLLSIRRTEHPKKGGMKISGTTEGGASLIVTAYADAKKPATASLVTG